MKKTIVFCLAITLAIAGFAQKLSVTDPRCEYKLNPSGIEAATPRLSWQLQSGEQNVMQTAYRVLVADQPSLLAKDQGNCWDSKKIYSGASIQVAYTGKKLQPAKTYYWKVMVWDNKGNQSNWSGTAQWQMGLPGAAGWKNAQWIAYERMPDSLKMIPAEHARGDKKWWNVKDTLPLLRKTFSVHKPVERATVFISGLGHFDMSINGKKVGDHFLDPGWTQYDKEALYVSFDVTPNLRDGDNAIGVMLGNGFYFMPRQRYRKLTGAFGFPKMICRLLIEYRDGSTENIVSDKTWKTAAGPITFSSIYGGEDYNANLEQVGWDTPSFGDNRWQQVVITNGPPLLKAQQAEPLKVMEIFPAKKIASIRDSVFVYDFGQNASGIPQISVTGKKGDTVRIVPAELLKDDGTANQRATGSPVYYEYVLKGKGIETWQPRFSYYGFRYLQVERAVPQGQSNSGSLPVIVDLKSLHTRNAAARVGEFSCSSELFNSIYQLIDWSVKSNMASVLTDCPHREKLGWLEQTYLMGNSIAYNYDVRHLFFKMLDDLETAQTKEGALPEFVPEYVQMDFMDGIFRESPEWGSAGIILPWYLYQWYGDKQQLKDHYSMMQRYLSYLQKRADHHIVSFGLSDWYDLGPAKPGLAQLTPMGLTATATYYYDITIMSKVARLLGKHKEALAYDQLAVQVRNAFNRKFFSTQTKQYATGSQTSNAMAVYMNLVEDKYRKEVVSNMIKNLQDSNYVLTAGDIGYRYLLQALEKEGYPDVIDAMNSRTDVPGYGYQLAKGATSLTESWQALSSVSNNHLMLGHLMEWFYSGLAGIRVADDAAGFNKIEIRPQPAGNIIHAAASYHCPYGLIKTAWTKTGDRFELNVTIPANTTATIYLPGQNKPVKTGSGVYQYLVQLKQ
jgi:alpha-L-rhamnosidase